MSCFDLPPYALFHVLFLARDEDLPLYDDKSGDSWKPIEISEARLKLHWIICDYSFKTVLYN